MIKLKRSARYSARVAPPRQVSSKVGGAVNEEGGEVPPPPVGEEEGDSVPNEVGGNVRVGSPGEGAGVGGFVVGGPVEPGVGLVVPIGESVGGVTGELVGSKLPPARWRKRAASIWASSASLSHKASKLPRSWSTVFIAVFCGGCAPLLCLTRVVSSGKASLLRPEATAVATSVAYKVILIRFIVIPMVVFRMLYSSQ